MFDKRLHKYPLDLFRATLRRECGGFCIFWLSMTLVPIDRAGDGLKATFQPGGRAKKGFVSTLSMGKTHNNRRTGLHATTKVDTA